MEPSTLMKPPLVLWNSKKSAEYVCNQKERGSNRSLSCSGGLPVYRTVVDVVSGKKDPRAARNIKADELQEMRDRMERLEALLPCAQGLQLQASPQRRAVGLHEKPEDVIRIFMMKGFTGGDFLYEQVVPQHEKWRRDALLCSLPAANKLSGIFAGDDGLP